MCIYSSITHSHVALPPASTSAGRGSFPAEVTLKVTPGALAIRRPACSELLWISMNTSLRGVGSDALCGEEGRMTHSGMQAMSIRGVNLDQWEVR